MEALNRLVTGRKDKIRMYGDYSTDVQIGQEVGENTEADRPATNAELEEAARRRAAIARNPEHRAWLAAHGLGHISPDEIFAA